MRKVLKEARIAAGMTQQKIADLIGICNTYYAKIEAGERTGDFYIWDTLEDIFGIHQRKLREETAELAGKEECGTTAQQITFTVDISGIKDISILYKKIDELKGTQNFFDYAESAKSISGTSEKHGLKKMIESVDKTLTEYLNNPHVTMACKKRIRSCLERHIDDIYRKAVMDTGWKNRDIPVTEKK